MKPRPLGKRDQTDYPLAVYDAAHGEGLALDPSLRGLTLTYVAPVRAVERVLAAQAVFSLRESVQDVG
jgi:hypothetical protein